MGNTKTVAEIAIALIAYASSWMSVGIRTCSAPRFSMRSGWVLCTGADRARRPRTWHRSPAGLRQHCAVGLPLEPVADDKFAVRLGFRQVRGLSNKDRAEIVAARADRPFQSVAPARCAGRIADTVGGI